MNKKKIIKITNISLLFRSFVKASEKNRNICDFINFVIYIYITCNTKNSKHKYLLDDFLCQGNYNKTWVCLSKRFCIWQLPKRILSLSEKGTKDDSSCLDHFLKGIHWWNKVWNMESNNNYLLHCLQWFM